MYVVEATTPDAYGEIVPRLADADARNSRGGEMREELIVLVKSDNPLERYLFRDDDYGLPFQLQEHWAYWEGANPGLVERYNPNMETWIDDDTGELPGSAYGDRMRNTAGHDQIERALSQLRDNPDTRRALVAVHQPSVEDYSSNDVACTAYLHLLLRDDELHMVATIRSQDMFWGYPYDTANNQWLQEAMACSLDVDVGEYWHLMDSCHYYTEYHDEAVAAVDEYEAVSAAPCMTGPDDFSTHWEALSEALVLARSGGVSYWRLGRLGGLFRDWLGVMTAYEQYRYCDNAPLADYLTREYVETPEWRDWLLERVSR